MTFIDKIPLNLRFKKEYLTNEIILKKDSLASSICYIKRGKIAKLNENSIIEEYPQYSIIGLDIMFSNIPFYEFDYKALELTSVDLISKDTLLNLNISLDIFSYLANEIVNLKCHNSLLSYSSNRDKVKNYLYSEYKKRSSTSFVISMTKRELSNFLNIDKEELSNILSYLIKNNIIANQNKLYTLIDLSFFNK